MRAFAPEARAPWATTAGPTLQKGWGTRKSKSRSLGPRSGPRDDNVNPGIPLGLRRWGTRKNVAASGTLAGAGCGRGSGGRGALRQEIPVLAGVLDDGGDIFYEQEAIRHQRVRRLLHHLQVFIARMIALFDREARIARLVAFRLRARERNVRAHQ